MSGIMYFTARQADKMSEELYYISNNPVKDFLIFSRGISDELRLSS